MNWIALHQRNLDIVEKYTAGYTIMQTAELTGLCKATVLKVLHQAAEQGLVTVRSRGRRRGSDRSLVNEATAVRMREQGSTYQQIGDAIGVTRQRAHQIVSRAMHEARREG